MGKVKVAVFDCKSYEKKYYEEHPHFEFEFFENRLNYKTAELSRGFEAILCFVNDHLDEKCIEVLSQVGVRFVGLRCAGFNNVDIQAARKNQIRVARVPGYSPQSVAEFALLQMLCLARKFHRSLNRTRELNFSLDGLVGRTLYGKKVGVIGVGEIGEALIHLLDGFNCKILAYDRDPKKTLMQDRDLQFVNLDKIFEESDYISLHVPLNKETFHLVDRKRLAQAKSNMVLINTGRGGLVDTQALIDAIKSKSIGGAALDVYEEEENYFSKDFSDVGIEDDQLARLISFPNVVVTSHQAFLTELSLEQISATTLENLEEYYSGKEITHEVIYE